MSLSSLIVQREVATMRQVEEALARQVIYGGDLVTNLMEVTRVDEGVLTRLLAESMGLAAAPSGELPVAGERVRALVPPEMAAQRAVVPLTVEGERLVLAVAEPMPHDLEEQLAFALGMTLEQRAAPTVRVKQAIARIYGVPLERRMQRLVARLSGEATPSGSMPPPLGAVPAVAEPPRPPSAPPQRPTTSRSFPGVKAVAPVEPPPEAAPPASKPESVPPSTPVVAERRTGLLQREVPASVRSSRRRRGPVTFETAKKEAEEAADRDGLLDLFFEFARQYFDYAALFLVHGDIAEGRDAFGTGASREKVVGIGVPLDLPGLMSNVRDQRAPVVTKVAATGLDGDLLADLQRPRDVEAAIVPVVVRTRVVALLVGDCGEHGVDRGSVQQVIAFSGIIGKAFERIIVRRKLDGFIAGAKGAIEGRVDPARVSIKRTSVIPQGSAPPPPANIAAMRSISGPPIPREEPPDSKPPRAGAAAAAPAPARFQSTSEPPTRPEAPLARARAASPAPPQVQAKAVAQMKAPSRPPAVQVEVIDEPGGAELFDELGWDTTVEDDPGPPPSAAIAVPPHAPPHRHTEPPAEPSVIVDMDPEIAAIVDRAVTDPNDEAAEGELLRQGERAMRVIMARFPGPVSFDRARIAVTPAPPRASECGPVLRLVARERKVALPFVLERLLDPDTEARGWATHVLCELPYVEAIGPLLLRLRDVDASTRASAALALAAIARVYPEEARAGVLGMSRSADPVDRVAAVHAMAELREPSLVPELVRTMADGDENVVAAAHAALVQVTRQDLGLDARPWFRWWELNSSRHRIEWLIDALTHDVAEIRRAAGDELRATSKEYFGYSADLPPRDRERSQQRYRDWWVTEGRARFRRRP